MRKTEVNMLSGSITKGLLAISIPVMVMNVMQSLFNIIDMTILKTYDPGNGIAVGAVYTRNPEKYLTRVVLLALVSQPLYAVGLAHENRAMYAVPFFDNPLSSCWQFYMNSWQTPSILFALSLGLLIMLCLRTCSR